MKKAARISLALALLLLAASAVACGETSTDPEETGKSTDEQTKPQETEEVKITDGMEKQDFGGMDFRIFTSNTLNGMEGPTVMNYADKENGEPVNDALYKRDRWLEEQFNVNVVTTVQADESYMFNAKYLQNAISAGDDLYDVMIQDIVNTDRSLAVNDKYIWALDLIDTINLDAPYWVPELNKPLNIGDHTYFAACPASPRYYTAAYVLLFNKTLASNIDLEENLYDLVKKGTWTIDKFTEISKLGLADLDGNGVYDVDDQYGFLWHSLNPTSFLLGSGYNIVENKDGTLVCNLEDAKLLNYIEKIADLYRLPSSNTEFYDDIAYTNEGHYLFCSPATMELDDYRTVDYDYGILPMPKETVEQKEYVSYAQPWILMSPVIPITLTGDRLDKVGTIVDALPAYGYDYIRPAIFEKVLQGKGTRDVESAEIIDLVYENISFDLMTIFKFDQLSATVGNYWASLSEGQGISSMYAAIKDSTEASMIQITQALKDHAEID